MKLRFPWYIRLAGIVTVLAGPIAYVFANPYIFWGGKENEAQRRVKGYHQVRYKNEADVQVHTEESKRFYEYFGKSKYPPPMYSKTPTFEEIMENGLYVIGSSSSKEGEKE